MKSEKHKSFSAIIMAAGQGSRMGGSSLPKTLHPVAGKPIVVRLCESLHKAGVKEIRLVISPEAEKLIEKLNKSLDAKIFIQQQALGTAIAVQESNPSTLNGDVIILNGDHPLIEEEDISEFIKEFRKKQSLFSVVIAKLEDPKHYGRMLYSQNKLRYIVEAKDASCEELKIKEINTGIFLIRAQTLNQYLPCIKAKKGGEKFISDLVEICSEHFEVQSIKGKKKVSFGVNSQEELSQATKFVFQRKALELMKKGVMIIDPNTTYIEESVVIKHSSVIYPGCYLRGDTHIESFCAIEPNSVLSSVKLKKGVVVRSGSVVEGQKIPAFSIIKNEKN